LARKLETFAAHDMEWIADYYMIETHDFWMNCTLLSSVFWNCSTI
jgi:hypothetical protein